MIWNKVNAHSLDDQQEFAILAKLLREGGNLMEDDLKRRIVYGLLSLALGALATRLAVYLTNKILGEPDSSSESIV